MDKNNKFFQTIFYKHDAIMLLIDPHTGNITKANAAAERFYGYTISQLCSMAIQDINMLSTDEVEQERQRALREERNYFIFPHRLASGEVRIVEVHSSPMTLDDTPILFSIIHDITKRKQIEKALQENEARFRLFFDSAPDAMFLVNLESQRVADANLAAQKLLNRSREEIIGLHFTNLHPPDVVAVTKEKFATHLFSAESSEDIHPIEHLALRADGSTVPIEVTARLLQVNGQMLMLGIFRDIGERKQMELALHESEERWQFALEGNGDGVWDWNVVTNEVHFSKRWAEMLGYTPSEIDPHVAEWERRIHPDDKSTVMQTLEQHFQGKTSQYTSEHRILHRDGTYLWILDRGKVIKRAADGSPLRMVGTHTDMTARKQIEDALRQAKADLEAALARVKKLEGILPICANCKKIRDDGGYWQQVEVYIRDHSEVEFSHSICPECLQELYPEFYRAKTE